MRARLVPALLVFASVCCMPATGQPACGLAGKPVVTLEGVIEKVQISRGEGMPYLEVIEAGKNVKVYLGSMRYLIEQDFRPKAGQGATITGYRFDGYVIAATVLLFGDSRVLQLRDAQGFPMWRGPRGWGARRGGQ